MPPETTSPGPLANVNWTRSSHTPPNGACVEVAYVDGYYYVRDSKARNKAPLCFNKEEWTSFTKGVKAGEFPG